MLLHCLLVVSLIIYVRLVLFINNTRHY